jgi:hypothetical protein
VGRLSKATWSWDLRGRRIQQSYKYDGTLNTCGEVRGVLAYYGYVDIMGLDPVQGRGQGKSSVIKNM